MEYRIDGKDDQAHPGRLSIDDYRWAGGWTQLSIQYPEDGDDEAVDVIINVDRDDLVAMAHGLIGAPTREWHADQD